MSEPQRHSDPDRLFDLVVPAGWSAAPDDEDGGLEIWDEEGVGSLHVIAFPHDEFPDPAEELYAFLQERGVELEEDEVEDLELGEDGELALCEYVAEDEDEAETLYWMVGVATSPAVLAFATYFCPAGQEERERGKVRAALESLRLHEPAGSPEGGSDAAAAG